MKRTFLSKKKLKLIDGSLPKPGTNDALLEAWERCNTMILSCKTTTLTPQIAKSIIDIDMINIP